MREVYFHGHEFLVPFLPPSVRMKTFPEISEDGLRKLQKAAEEFTAAQTYAARQKILEDYAAGIDAKNPANAFYRSMLGMTLNLRRDALNQENNL